MKEGDFVVTPGGDIASILSLDETSAMVDYDNGGMDHFLLSQLQPFEGAMRLQAPMVVIVIEGGTIRSVAATVPGLSCTIVDLDNIREGASLGGFPVEMVTDAYGYAQKCMED